MIWSPNNTQYDQLNTKDRQAEAIELIGKRTDHTEELGPADKHLHTQNVNQQQLLEQPEAQGLIQASYRACPRRNSSVHKVWTTDCIKQWYQSQLESVHCTSTKIGHFTSVLATALLKKPFKPFTIVTCFSHQNPCAELVIVIEKQQFTAHQGFQCYLAIASSEDHARTCIFGLKYLPGFLSIRQGTSKRTRLL